MSERSVIDEALKLGAILAIAIWSAKKGYEYGYKRARKEKEYESSK